MTLARHAGLARSTKRLGGVIRHPEILKRMNFGFRRNDTFFIIPKLLNFCLFLSSLPKIHHLFSILCFRRIVPQSLSKKSLRFFNGLQNANLFPRPNATGTLLAVKSS
jgi:hypothetical protein